MSAPYCVVPSTTVTPARIARARTYRDIADAVAAMGEGVVLGADGHLAAFHERHLAIVERQEATR